MPTFYVLISCAIVNTSCPFTATVKIPIQAISKSECMEKAQAVAAPYAEQVHISCKKK